MAESFTHAELHLKCQVTVKPDECGYAVTTLQD